MSVSHRPAALRGRLLDHLRSSWRILIKELAAFGLIGALAFAIDFGIFTWLTHVPNHHDLVAKATVAKAISTVFSTTFAYVGNRYLSFSHRARTTIGRETSFFFGINLITLAFSELALALFVHGFGYSDASTTVVVVNLVSIGIGTVFRFWSYKRFVFLHPDRVHARDVDLDRELAE